MRSNVENKLCLMSGTILLAELYSDSDINESRLAEGPGRGGSPTSTAHFTDAIAYDTGCLS